ncbi:helix-turn-helix domain-containing protein [Paenibacillus sp. JMULE4]|uniref:helix-turn-helix domain-containing protein n=1 Tax=Paenibacillus sp. JMULE4 TaxID=2518342 RepID=UPI0020C6E0AF|nr:helix-turn-helix domain-containing protein [Paenibacillus sp. JMULE4]
MDNGSHLSMQLAACQFRLEDIQHVNSNESIFQHDHSLYGMLLFKEAEGSIVIDGRSYSLQRQKIFIVSPGTYVKLFIQNEQADYYYIRFYALRPAGRGHFVLAELKCPDELFASHFQFLIDMVQKMEIKHRSDNSWDAMKANIMFQEMIITLFKDTIQEEKSDLQQAIRLTLDYMEQYYPLNITREKLAEMTGLSADYFSRAFKKQVKKSPMKVLTEIRINQAKQLLVQSGESFRSIAQSVGFSDEFYFSRKFKAETGCSPMNYVKKIKYSGKIASLNHQTTGHLIALDIEPYAAIINNAYPITTRLRNTIAVGHFNPDLERLMTAKPDLIVASGSRQVEKSPKERIFNQIAPTITLHFSKDWRVHFQTIAKIVGKEKEANDWLERYDWKADTIRKQIKSKIGDETFLIVGIGEGKMCVYGLRNMGSVLYGDLGLAAPKGVSGIAHYKEILLEDLLEFDADRILLTSYRHDGTAHMDQAIRNEVCALYANKQWHALKAVRNKKVYFMYDSQHLYTSYNPLSHDLFLDKMHQLLMADAAAERSVLSKK